MNNIILAIDPGNIDSGYVAVEHNSKEIISVLDKGKVENDELYEVINYYIGAKAGVLAIEMIASYGMPVGKSVFDTCVWIGRLMEYFDMVISTCGVDNDGAKYIYRSEEKINLCNNMKAKDANIRQALIDRFAPDTPNKGKGNKKAHGFFYGFKSDIWAAMAVATTYFDLYVKEAGQCKE